MTDKLIIFLTYLIEFFSYLMLAFKSMDKKFPRRISFWGIFTIISGILASFELMKLNTITTYLFQAAIFLFFNKIYFQCTIKVSVYLYAFIFSLNGMIQIFTMLPLMVIPELMKYALTPVAALLVTAFICYLLYRFVPLQIFFDFTLNSPFSYRLFFANLFIILISILFYFKLDTNSFLQMLFFILLVIVSIFCINFDMISTHFKMNKMQDELQAYQKYLPILEELIYDVRSRQHNFDNTIQSFAALPLGCSDYDSIVSALNKYSKDAFRQNVYSDLLRINYKLVAGFLYYKQSEAKGKNRILNFTIENYALQTVMPEYILVECIGILIDNAVEAVAEGTIIPIKIDSKRSKFYMTVSNPGPELDDVLIRKFFQKGYTTKTADRKKHGLGLFYLQQTISKYKGSIFCSNSNENGRTYIHFRLEI